MEGARTPPDEVNRLVQLRALALLDSEPEERFDRVTRLAQRLFGVPIALVSLVDADRQWFKSRQGLDATETPRETSFCAHAILADEVLQVRDATTDIRFVDNPLVTGDPKIRFYAGCPIAGPGGAKLGTLCLIGREPRVLSDDDIASLRDLAEMVEREIAALQAASVDELTGLSNRRGFELLATKMLEVCRRRALVATLLFIDLDGFKSINDTFGHEAGDRALREFARILEDTFRASDVIARLGGDEFAVLLSATTDRGEAADRLLASLELRNRDDVTYQLRASIGTARTDADSAEPLEALLGRADAGMYEHKHRASGHRT